MVLRRGVIPSLSVVKQEEECAIPLPCQTEDWLEDDHFQEQFWQSQWTLKMDRQYSDWLISE